MDFKRALGWGFVWWLTAYFLGTLIWFSPLKEQISYIFWVLGPILVLIFGWFYFKKTKKEENKLVEGLGVGVSWLLMSIILDYLFIVLLFKTPAKDYFGVWQVWVGYLEIIIFVVVAVFVFHSPSGNSPSGNSSS